LRLAYQRVAMSEIGLEKITAHAATSLSASKLDRRGVDSHVVLKPRAHKPHRGPISARKIARSIGPLRVNPACSKRDQVLDLADPSCRVDRFSFSLGSKYSHDFQRGVPHSSNSGIVTNRRVPLRRLSRSSTAEIVASRGNKRLPGASNSPS